MFTGRSNSSLIKAEPTTKTTNRKHKLEAVQGGGFVETENVFICKINSSWSLLTPFDYCVGRVEEVALKVL